MRTNSKASKESGLVLLALFVLIIIGIIVAAFLYVLHKQRQLDGGKTQINIQSTINL